MAFEVDVPVPLDAAEPFPVWLVFALALVRVFPPAAVLEPEPEPELEAEP